MIKITKIKKVINEKLNNNLFKVYIKKNNKSKVVSIENKKGKYIDFYA